jgi:hypothetical protein
MTVASFATLINQRVLMPSPRTQYVAVERDHLVHYLKPILQQIFLDADWYVRVNPDIAQAIAGGILANAADHYVTCGYYEHRMPYEIRVNEGWYLAQYPDVAEAVGRGLFASARDHYYASGYREGRLPHAHFALRIIEHAS